jgi:hypothetical protein
MARRVPLDNVEHAQLRVAPSFGPQFGDAVNQTTILPTEYDDAHREYPIVFRRETDGRFQSIAILGFDAGENLFLDGHLWSARYVPAAHRRGPFFLGTLKREEFGETFQEPVIHVNLDDPRVTQDGEPLFREHGGNAPYLNYVTSAFDAIRDGVQVSPAMFEAFNALALMEPLSLNVELADGRQFRFPELFSISAERLTCLDGVSLERLNRYGFLAAAIFVRSSLGNLPRLVELKNAQAHEHR